MCSHKLFNWEVISENKNTEYLIPTIQIMIIIFKSSRPEVFFKKDVLKICSKFTGEHKCRSVISIKLLCNFIEITLRHGCSPVNLLHIFRTLFSRNTSGWLLQKHCKCLWRLHWIQNRQKTQKAQKEKNN